MADLSTPNTNDGAAPAPLTRGLVLVHTGNGKGKTTAAVGLLLRAWGQGRRVCMIQFIKGENEQLGELQVARALGIEWHQLGDGFTRRSPDMAETIRRNRAAWALAQGKISGGAYDLIVLDEFTYLLKYGWLDVDEVVTWLQAHKPAALHLAITGRDAPAALVAYADLVTEMAKVKHHYDEGICAQAGIEY